MLNHFHVHRVPGGWRWNPELPLATTLNVIAGEALHCPGIWDAVGKRRIASCHQEDCVCNERNAAARTETIPL